MTRKGTVHLRLPMTLLDAISNASLAEDKTLSQVIRDTLQDELDAFDLEQEYESAKQATLTFVASEALRKKASQAALLNGTSRNALFIQLLSKGLGVLPCHVVAEVEDEVEL